MFSTDDSAQALFKTSIGFRRSLLPEAFAAYMDSQGVQELLPWQLDFLFHADPRGWFTQGGAAYEFNDDNLLFGRILQLPPGAGKTLISTWLIVRRLIEFPTHRVIFALPLRALAKQVSGDVSVILEMVGQLLIGKGISFSPQVEVLEGPGAKAHLNDRNVFIATYEHAASILRQVPDATGITITVGTVIIDEVHEIMKDRGLVVDDVLFFSRLRALASNGLPMVNVMSGTLPGWVVKRLKVAYGDTVLANETISMQAAATTTSIVPVNISRRGQAIALAREVVSNILDMRLSNQGTQPKLVCFMSTVGEAESVFMGLATPEITEKAVRWAQLSPHVSPDIELPMDAKALKDACLDPQADRAQLKSAIRWLMAAGIYVHHAGITGAALEDGSEPKDAIIDQITNFPGRQDFTAVISTSTISTGLNLAAAQVAILGPNTMWSVDQAQQMIGRVGRKGAGDSVAFVSSGLRYMAPGGIFISFPDSWFVSRLTAALGFAAVLARNDRLHDGVGFIPLGEDERGVIGLGNFDIRGFYGPRAGAAIGADDIPGNGIVPKAVSWGLIDERGGVLQAAKTAIKISSNDPMAIPITSILLGGPITPTTVIAWQLLLCWADVNTGSVKGAWKSAKPPLGVQAVGTPEERELIKRMAAVYGETHARFPGDPGVPDRLSAVAFIGILSAFMAAMARGSGVWPIELAAKRATARNNAVRGLVKAAADIFIATAAFAQAGPAVEKTDIEVAFETIGKEGVLAQANAAVKPVALIMADVDFAASAYAESGGDPGPWLASFAGAFPHIIHS